MHPGYSPKSVVNMEVILWKTFFEFLFSNTCTENWQIKNFTKNSVKF